jgi:hypothetical protein
MTTPEGQSPEQTEQQVNDLFDSVELTRQSKLKNSGSS